MRGSYYTTYGSGRDMKLNEETKYFMLEWPEQTARLMKINIVHTNINRIHMTIWLWEFWESTASQMESEPEWHMWDSGSHNNLGEALGRYLIYNKVREVTPQEAEVFKLNVYTVPDHGHLFLGYA